MTRWTLAVMALALALSVPTMAAEEKKELKLSDFPKNDDGAFVLFNGKDLTGWEGMPGLWSVEEGTIVGQTKADPKLASNTFLILTADVPQDFELRVKWRMDNGNSGIQFRSKRFPADRSGNQWIVGGYQADIADNQYLGILYEERGPRGIAAEVGQKVTLGPDKKKAVEKFADGKAIRAALDHKQWNETVITVKGNTIVQTINGTKTIEVIDDDEKNRAMDGIIALQLHVGPPMRIQFKDITIKPLGETK